MGSTLMETWLILEMGFALFTPVTIHQGSISGYFTAYLGFLKDAVDTFIAMTQASKHQVQLVQCTMY